MGSIVLPHLQTAWHVDQAILSEEERLVVIRFGRDHDPDCKCLRRHSERRSKLMLERPGIRQDEVLYKIAERVKSECQPFHKQQRTAADDSPQTSRSSTFATWTRSRTSTKCTSSTIG
jgi:hypothetical protein